MSKKFAIKISGPAGTGIMVAGETFSKALNRLGFFTLVYPEYPSRIRGGDNNIQVVFSTRGCLAPQEKIDILLAFGRKNLEVHRKELGKDGLAFEENKIAINKIAKKLGNPLVLNTVGLGFLWARLGFEIEALKAQIKEDFENKKELVQLNIKAAEKGYEKGKDIGLSCGLCVGKCEVGMGKRIENLTGNEALVKGILAGGCGFAAIYPMTPINAILNLLAKSKVNLFRPEDEIAGIMAAIGASYAGKRAMVATSGGGFSLMVEGLGMAGMTETPLVVVLGQRTGPSSGIPTFSSQADLNFAIYGGHGEFPRIVLTPGDLPELFRLGAEAFGLAEKYQVPVILMTDKYLAESRFSVRQEEINKIKIYIGRGKLFKEDYNNYKQSLKSLRDYNRYKIIPGGISPRVLPGQTSFLTNSYEHDEFGFSTDEAEIRRKMMEKRMGKLDVIDGGFEVYGPLSSRVRQGEETTLVSWGSTKGVLLDFINEHPEYNLLHFWRPWPVSKEAGKILRKSKRVIVVEANFSGQLADLIGKETGLRPGKILKDDGRPFFKEELSRLLK